MSISPRRRSVGVNVGGVMVGGGAPIVVQSMTNTDTADIEATVRQVAQLWRAGSEIVRITVDRDEAAAALSSRSTVMRTSSEPARQSCPTCLTVASMSAVSVLVIDWTTMGAPPPTVTPPTLTPIVCLRGRMLIAAER
jgi:hypothetical protein